MFLGVEGADYMIAEAEEEPSKEVKQYLAKFLFIINKHGSLLYFVVSLFYVLFFF